MSLWLSYGLLGAVTGPFVAIFGSSVARREAPSWRHISRDEWAPMLAASALLCVTLGWVAERRPSSAGAVSWLVIVGLLLALIDWICHRLPHRVVGALLGGGMTQLGLTGIVQHDAAPLFRASVAAVVVFVIALTIALMSRSGLGVGDVTLSATVAFFLGWFSWWHVVTGLVLALALGVITFGVLRLMRRYHQGLLIPLGPALIFAPVCTILMT